MKTAITVALLALSTTTFAQQGNKADNTKADAASSTQFEKNKGHLQMPVTNGVISGHFGKQTNPSSATQTINQDGVDIAATGNAAVHAVFNGTVSKVFKAGTSTVIILQHGSYFTVYNNMATANVKAGQHVAAGEDMGMAASDNGKTYLNFQVWHAVNKGQNEKLDPEKWLKG